MLEVLNLTIEISSSREYLDLHGVNTQSVIFYFSAYVRF